MHRGGLCVRLAVKPDAIILDIVESLGISCSVNLAAVFFKHLMGLRKSLFRFVYSIPTLMDLCVRQQIPQHLKHPWSVGH
jgi:hypothetical protein